MDSEYIGDIKTDNKVTFGKIISRERKKSKKSLKQIEEDLTAEKEVIKDGVTKKEEVALITASYLNRIENESRVNISFPMVCLLIKTFNLDLVEVFKSFGHEDLVDDNIKQKNIETMIRVNNFEVPIKIGSQKGNKPLTNIQKEMVISILNNVFEFGTTDEDNTMYTLRKLFSDLDDYRKSRRKSTNNMIEDTTI